MRTIAPEENCPPVRLRVRVLLRVGVIFRVGVQFSSGAIVIKPEQTYLLIIYNIGLQP